MGFAHLPANAVVGGKAQLPTPWQPVNRAPASVTALRWRSMASAAFVLVGERRRALFYVAPTGLRMHLRTSAPNALDAP